MICCARIDCDAPATHFRPPDARFRVCAAHYWPEAGEVLINNVAPWGETLEVQSVPEPVDEPEPAGDISDAIGSMLAEPMDDEG